MPGEQAAIALASFGRQAFQPLTNQLLSEDTVVRRNAAWAIGELTNMPPGERDDARVRQLAVWALSELKDKRDVTPLCNVLLSDLSAEVRRGAAEALGEIRSADALPFLKQALNDPKVRARAQWAIDEIEGN